MNDRTTPEVEQKADEREADEREVDGEADEREIDGEANEREVDGEANEREADGETDTPDGRAHVLDVENLGHSFGEVDVFSDLSFSVESGTVTALVGPNGSGKTTLLRAILGLLDSNEGDVALTAEGATGRRTGYLPQSPRFRPVFTVEETLQFYADLLDREVDVSAVVKRVGLSEASDRRVDALSGGMTRLLGVGQAILGDPPLVVLDEPTGDLDPRMTEYIFDVIRNLADDGMAVLLATHNLTGAEEADTVLLLDNGNMVAEASPADLVEQTGTDNFREAFIELTGGRAGPAEGETPEGETTEDEPGTPTVSVRTQGGDDE